jgi:predicted flap endonuclease-1-like 5' DNA nuclease
VAEPAGSPPEPGPPRGEFAHLRSVRSEGLRGVPAAHDARSGEMDDLKRIRGIGVLIEKKLNSMGVTRYDQIAKWTSSDIDRVSNVLDFKGRIERENWVEQARILASGGETEFSRRADRGDFGGA